MVWYYIGISIKPLYLFGKCEISWKVIIKINGILIRFFDGGLLKGLKGLFVIFNFGPLLIIILYVCPEENCVSVRKLNCNYGENSGEEFHSLLDTHKALNYDIFEGPDKRRSALCFATWIVIKVPYNIMNKYTNFS